MSDMTGQGQAGSDTAAAAPPSEPAERPKSIFVSYARQDQDKVRQIVEGFRVLEHSVWFDEGLVGGEEWWDEILHRIRGCDVFVQVISGHATKSAACDSERKYAVALRKKVLPVMLERMPGASLPGDLVGLQFIDYVDAAPAAAFRLARSVDGAPMAPPLPEPLPEAPRPPLSYLVALGDKVRSQDPLSIDEQLAIVGTIRTALGHPEDIDGADDLDAAERLLKDLRRRRDVYARVAEEIDQALAQVASVRRELFAPEPETTAPSPEPQVASFAVAHPPVATPAPAPATEAQPAATSTSASPAAADIKPHWVMAIVSAVLFLITGIFAIINAARVRPALERGDTAAAEKASGRVKLFFWISVAIFVLVVIIASAGE